MANGAPPWLVRAASYLGFHEVGVNLGIEHFIDDSHTGHLGDPWCAIFANACLEEEGVPGTRSAAARSFEHSDNFVRLPDPALGCIVTRWRGSPSSGQGHVFFYCGENANGIVAIAGNEADAVRRYYETNRNAITGYWWPAGTALPIGGPVQLPAETALGPAAWEGSPQTPPPFSATRSASPATPAQVTSGLGSWYSQHEGKYSWVDKGDGRWNADKTAYLGPDNALGVPDDQQGCAFFNHPTLGRWFDVTAPNGVTLRIRQTDIGPNPKTGRKIDIAAVAAERFGYTPQNFPTDDLFHWSPAGLTPLRSAKTPEQPMAPPPATQIDPNALAQALVQAMQMARAAIPQEQKKSMLAAFLPVLGAIFSAGGAAHLGIWGVVASVLAGTGAPFNSQSILTGALGLLASGFTQMINRFTQQKSNAQSDG